MCPLRRIYTLLSCAFGKTTLLLVSFTTARPSVMRMAAVSSIQQIYKVWNGRPLPLIIPLIPGLFFSLSYYLHSNCKTYRLGSIALWGRGQHVQIAYHSFHPLKFDLTINDSDMIILSAGWQQNASLFVLLHIPLCSTVNIECGPIRQTDGLLSSASCCQ